MSNHFKSNDIKIISEKLRSENIKHEPLRVISEGVNRLILTDYSNIVVRVSRMDAGSHMFEQAEIELAWGFLYSRYEIPCTKPVLPKPILLSGGKLATIWSYREGSHYAGDKAVLVADALKELHSKTVVENDFLAKSNDLFKISRQMVRSCPSLAQEYLELIKVAEFRYDEIMNCLPKVITHGDPHFGNILLENSNYFFIDLQDAGMRPSLHDWIIVYSTLKNDIKNQQNFASTYNSSPGLTETNIKILMAVRSCRTLIVKHSSGRYKNINFEESIKTLRNILEST